MVQSWVGRFWDARWVTWGVEDFSFCRAVEYPLALGLVVLNAMRYGGDTTRVLPVCSKTRIKLLEDDFFGFAEVMIAGKSYMRRYESVRYRLLLILTFFFLS